jgi:hypothetical protein
MGTATGGNAANATTVTFTSHDPAKPTVITINARRKRLAVADDIVTRLRELQQECHTKWLDGTVGWLWTEVGDAADEIERLRAAGDSMAKLLTRLPCSCVEGSNGEINETCEMCERFFHWEEARRG